MTQSEPIFSSESETHFGFQTVKRGEKAGLVKGVFDRVAEKYDLMNDVMSVGLHRLWKNTLVDCLNPRPGELFLDVAGGTGDIAFRIRERCNRLHGAYPDIILCDINHAMLLEGRQRALDHGILNGISWNCGDAMALPVQNASIDAYTIAFGIRNVTDIDMALREARRVLKPGGRFFCLEFSQVTIEPMAKLYDTYSLKLIPQLGKIFAGASEPYQYLVESIRRFPNQKAFAEKIRAAGFGNVSYRNLNGGIVAIHSGWRI